MSILEEIFYACIMIMLIAAVVCGITIGLILFAKLVIEIIMDKGDGK